MESLVVNGLSLQTWLMSSIDLETTLMKMISV
jgi:hypothetical protein